MVELLMNWLADAIAVLLDVAISWLSPITGFEFEMFNKAFPFALEAYEIFQQVALVLVLLIAGFHLLPWLFPSDQQSKTSPIRLAFCVVLAVAFIFYGNYILEGVMAIANYPFQALVDTSGVDFNLGTGFDVDTDFGVVITVLSDTFGGVSILLYIIAMLLIGIAFIKLMIEAIERYVIMMLLIYASPLAASTLASPTTSGIYKKFFSMFISQCILVVLNMWVMKMVISMFSNLNTLSGVERIIGLLMAYAALRIGARLDSYLNQLGLNAAITGAGLAGELLGAGMTLAAAGKMVKGNSDKGDGGVGGGILGAVSKAGNFIGKYSPIANAGTAMGSVARASYGVAFGGAGKTIGQSVGAGVRNAMDKSAPGKNMASRFGSGFSQAFTQNIGPNMDDVLARSADKNAVIRKMMKPDIDKITQRMTGKEKGMIVPSERADIKNHSFMADGIYENIAGSDDAIKSPVDVANIMQGIGADANDSQASEFIGVAYGNVNADNISFGMDGEGIHASYDKGTYRYQMKLVDDAQYRALSFEEQQGYEQFSSKTGKVYYQRHTTDRIPPPHPKTKSSGSGSGSSRGSNVKNNRNSSGGSRKNNYGGKKNGDDGNKAPIRK